MTAWWRSLRVLPARRRHERVRVRRALVLGVEQLESRRLLAVLTTDATAGFVLSNTSVWVSESGMWDAFSVALTAQPSTDVFLSVVSGDTSEATVSYGFLTFTADNWDQQQLVMVAGVDDPLVDGDQVTQITVSVNSAASDGSFAEVPAQDVTVTTTDNDFAGFTVSGTTAGVSENETTDTFTIHLGARPETNVVLTVISADPDEATVSPTVLTFSPADWNLPQTVTVTGVDDTLLDGSQSTLVTISVADDESDNNFADVSDQAVSVITTDNEVAGFVLSKTTVTVTEAGSTGTFTIALTAQPATSVTLAAISGDAGEATVSPTVLTFAPADWDVPQTVTVTGVDDPQIDDSQTTFVTVSVAVAISDQHFDQVADQTVSVTTTDDDVAGFTLSKSIAVVSESGTSDTFTVVLTAQPETNVTLTVTSSDTGEATVSPAVLVFTPGGWNSSQMVTIEGADDSSRDDDQLSLVTIAVDAGQSDADFGGVPAQTVSVTTTDDDHSWQNLDNPFNVSGNGPVDATDVLLLINYINANSGSPTLPSPPASPPPYYDVNNDGRCTAFDVLLVINYINNLTSAGVSTSGAGEGEGESNETPRSNVAPLNASSDPASVPSADVQLVPAFQDRPASNPAGSSRTILSTLGLVPSDPAGPAATTRAALVPVPVTATALLEPIDADVPDRTAALADDQWIQAVDASLEDWEPGWENPLESLFTA